MAPSDCLLYQNMEKSLHGHTNLRDDELKGAASRWSEAKKTFLFKGFLLTEGVR